MRFVGKVALVTGAGTGIGRATALSFAREGAVVALAARRLQPLQETAREIEKSGGRCLIVTADISRESQVQDMVSRVLDECGPIDVLVANAGIPGVLKSLAKMSVGEFMEPYLTNNIGTFLTIREVLRRSMLARGRGVIITISSRAGKRGYPGRTAYSSSRFGLIGLTQSLAWELGPRGIRVNCVCPGAVRTETLLGSFRERAAVTGETFEQVEAHFRSMSPLERFPTPEEAANLILFLCSDESSGMTGQAINISAGGEMR